MLLYNVFLKKVCVMQWCYVAHVSVYNNTHWSVFFNTSMAGRKYFLKALKFVNMTMYLYIRLTLKNTHLINIHAWYYSLIIYKPFLQVQIQKTCKQVDILSIYYLKIVQNYACVVLVSYIILVIILCYLDALFYFQCFKTWVY